MPEEIVFNVIREKWTFYLFLGRVVGIQNVRNTVWIISRRHSRKYRSIHVFPIEFRFEEEEIDCWFKNETEI